MPKSLKIGLTGGIAAGKSTVCRIFEVLEVPIYYADNKARELMGSEAGIIKELKQQFGDAVYLENGALNKPLLREKVFGDPMARETINGIVHPRLARDFQQWADARDSSYVIEEAAILIESGSYKNMDAVIVVDAPEALIVERLIKRDGIDKKAAGQRIDSQLSREDRLQYADFIINNDGSHLAPQVFKIHLTLTRQFRTDIKKG